MRLTNMSQVDDFIEAVEKCRGKVKLYSQYGDIYNLKSKFSQYVGIAALLREHGDELELYCFDKSDEKFMFEFFNKHPEVMAPVAQEGWKP